MKFIIEFISNMEFLLPHAEEFCDHFAIILRKKTVFRDKCGNFTSNGYRNLELILL